ncbi:hypothetical protein KDA11_04000 [Candidatus Saccharibacteria bacterium]|nr:hypothetical protein [Candidatus Saccharibacteria bacterium]
MSSKTKIVILVAVLILVIICDVLLLRYLYGNSLANTSPVEAYDENKYLVHKKFKNRKEAANLMAQMHERTILLMKHLKGKYDNDGVMDENDDIVRRLTRGYDVDNIVENSPHNLQGTTSFTQNKGDLMAFCLRSKETHQLHDINTMMFVKIHELSHIACRELNHPPKFWEIFAKLLNEAAQVPVIELVDYSKHPVRYCGMLINHSPYFDYYSG